jgi:phage antirepressor YoqD-like protein
MQQIAIFGREEQTMNSKEMADLVEKRHDSVKRTIETLVTAGAISKPQIVDGEKAANNVVEKLYVFGKRDSYVIVAQLSPTFTARLVDRWQELEQKQMVALPNFSNPAEAARAWATQYEARQVLEAKVTADAPKVKFAEIIRAMDGVCHIGDFCKTMGIGRNKLFRMMKADKILMENRMPYQKYVDKGYFSVIEQKPYTNSKGETHVTFTTMVTGAGQVFLAKRYAHLAGEV